MTQVSARCGWWGHGQIHGHIPYTVGSVMLLDTGSGRGCRGRGSNPTSLGGVSAEMATQWRQEERVFQPEKGALVYTVFQMEGTASAKVPVGAWPTWWTKMKSMWIGVKLGGDARERQSDKILWLDDRGPYEPGQEVWTLSWGQRGASEVFYGEE